MPSITHYLLPNIIYETIVTTADKDGQPNAASMGITIGNDNRLTIKPFFSSDTFRNIKATNKCAVNFTQDPILFTQATLFQEELTPEFFIISKKGNVPVLQQCADNYLAVTVFSEKIDPNKDRAIFICDIIHEEFSCHLNYPYTRAFSSLIELLIHSTRIIYFSQEKKNYTSKIKQLQALFIHHLDVINRVTDDKTIYPKLAKKIQKKINPFFVK